MRMGAEEDEFWIDDMICSGDFYKDYIVGDVIGK